MISVGFDPVFRDITVKLFSEDGSLARSLPPPGVHHPYSSVSEMAGGNGVNVYKSLQKLGVESELVIACDQIFAQLLNSEGFSFHQFAELKSNSTIILSYKYNETQINAVAMELGKSLWNEELHKRWGNSPISVSTNWWLNPLAPDWVACQILSSCGIPYSEIIEDPVKQYLSMDLSLNRPFITDPGMISKHKDADILISILRKLVQDPKSVLMGNEHEIPSILPNLREPHLVIEHRADSVRIIEDGVKTFIPVPPLPDGDRNFVGAGDAFLAGFVSDYVTDPDSAVSKANFVARAHILGTPAKLG